MPTKTTWREIKRYKTSAWYLLVSLCVIAPKTCPEQLMGQYFNNGLYLLSSWTEQVLSKPQVFRRECGQGTRGMQRPAVCCCMTVTIKCKKLLNKPLDSICYRTSGNAIFQDWQAVFAMTPSWVTWGRALNLMLWQNPALTAATLLASRHLHLICFRSSFSPISKGLCS